MAKSFHFPLQKVLDLRKMIEETRTLTLRGSEAVLKQEQNKLTNLRNRKDKVITSKANVSELPESFSPNDLQISMDYILQLNKMISTQNQQVDKSNSIVNNERDDLVEASKDKKIVEKLREHKLADYAKNYRRKETKMEDEIAARIMNKSKLARGNT